MAAVAAAAVEVVVAVAVPAGAAAAQEEGPEGRDALENSVLCWWFPPITRRPVRNRFLEEVGSHTGKVANRPDGDTDT